jgi:hypothetical protein
MSGVFRNIDPPPPSPHGECVRGGTHSPCAEGGWGVNSSEDARHWIGLLQYNPLVRGGEDTLAEWRGGRANLVRKTPDTALYSIYVRTLRYYLISPKKTESQAGHKTGP